MSKLFDSNQQFGCGQNGCGQNDSLCPTCEESFTPSTTTECPDGNPRCSDAKLCKLCQAMEESMVETRGGGVVSGGNARRDVVPLQNLTEICSDCKINPDPYCQVCAKMKMTQKVSPFTKEQIELLYAELKSGFRPSPTGRIFDLVYLFSLMIGSIDWTMHNCAFSTLVLMLANSNAGMNSINQQTFAGYLLAFMINTIQKTGKCDPIILEVFRFELTILSRNPAWRSWSILTDFEELYNFCIQHRIIINYDVHFVPPNDGSYNLRNALDGKAVSVLLEAQRWVPSIEDLSNGILSENSTSRFRISSVVFFDNDHFFIILIRQGFWLVDGKGKRTGEFTAESTKRKLSIDEFNGMCSQCGAFYFLEQTPLEYEHLLLSGIQRFPPIMVIYQKITYFLCDNGTMICEETNRILNLERSIFVLDFHGRHFRVFPPPPPVHCASGLWSPPPPLAPSAQVAWVPSPPQQASSAQVVQALPLPQQASSAQDVKYVIFRFNDGKLEHANGFPLSKWTYTYQVENVCFKATGTFKDESYSDRKYFYNDKQYNGFLIQTALRDECVKFLKQNPPK